MANNLSLWTKTLLGFRTYLTFTVKQDYSDHLPDIKEALIPLLDSIGIISELDELDDNGWGLLDATSIFVEMDGDVTFDKVLSILSSGTHKTAPMCNVLVKVEYGKEVRYLSVKWSKNRGFSTDAHWTEMNEELSLWTKELLGLTTDLIFSHTVNDMKDYGLDQYKLLYLVETMLKKGNIDYVITKTGWNNEKDGYYDPAYSVIGNMIYHRFILFNNYSIKDLQKLIPETRKRSIKNIFKVEEIFKKKGLLVFFNIKPDSFSAYCNMHGFFLNQ